LTTQQHNPPARKFGLPNLLLILGLSVLLCGEAYFGYRVHTLADQRKQIKEDYSTIKSITFGLFSVDEWRDKIVAIVNGQVQDYTMTPEQKKQLQAQVEQALNGLIDKAVAQINKPQKGLGAKLKKFAFNSFVNTDDIHAQVPSFARTIINKVNSPASQGRLKDIATGKINQLAKQTYDSTETAKIAVSTYMYHKYHVTNADEFQKEIDSQLATIRQLTFNCCYEMLGCVVAALGLWWLMRKQVRLQSTLFFMSLFFALILLLVGITSSIVEVDARLQTLNFMLMGQKVVFQNQVLFFQSKSIFDIVKVLLGQSKPDAIVVGSLILVFVIGFPILRMIARGIHLLSSETFAKNKVLKYLAFDAGKWDMADVMVVGTIMTYIGLNGILKSQLTELNIHNGLLNTITENDTSLQPGYFVFVGYVIFAFILSYILKRITPPELTVKRVAKQ
jgi:hypothetical protein